MRSRHRFFLSNVATLTMVALLLGAGSVSAAAQTRALPAPDTAPQQSAGIVSKDEIVYARLAAGGGVQGIYVVNHFEVAAAGTVVDHGNYAQVMNLTDTGPLEQAGDTVTFQAQQGNFYYQGNMATANLPWLFTVTYLLDGAAIEPQQLAGRSGALEIRITSQANTGVDATFYDNYMLQISVTLDTDLCAGIQAPGGTMASAGKNQVVTFTAMPGKNASCSVTAQVHSFTMAGIEVAGIPYAMEVELPDTDEMVDEMATLADAISALDDGVGELSSGAAELNNGVGKLVKGSADYGDGMAQLSANSGKLVDGSAQINSALALVAGQLGGAGGGSLDLGDLAQLPAGLRQLATGLDNVVNGPQGLAVLQQGYGSLAAGLGDVISGIPADDPDAAGLAALQAYAASEAGAGNTAAASALQQLIIYRETARALKDTGLPAIKTNLEALNNGFTAYLGGLDTITASINTMADEIETALGSSDLMVQLQQLAGGLAQLSTQYGNFHSGLVEYMDGVTQAADGYGQLHSGIVDLYAGTDELAGGTRQLNEGTGELNEAVAGLPDTIQTEIDSLMADYTGADFPPVSFTSPQNSDTGFVQFVMMFAGIELPEEEAPAGEEAPQETLWDRLLALF